MHNFAGTPGMQTEAPQQAASAPALPLRPKVHFRTLTLTGPSVSKSMLCPNPYTADCKNSKAEPMTADLGTRPYAEWWGTSPLHVISESALTQHIGRAYLSSCAALIGYVQRAAAGRDACLKVCYVHA